MNFQLTASMMCADFGHLEQEIKDLEKAGIDSFHIDIMDGRYVPNFAMSLNDLQYIRSVATKPMDVHLMIEHPRTHIDLFLKNLHKGDTVYIHPEAEYHPSTTLQKIIDAGMIPGIAINPGTSVETVYEMLRIVDKVLVMSVNPGNAGQMYLPYVGEKVKRLISLREEMGGPEVLIGSGVKAAVIAEFLEKVPGARAFHMSGKTEIESDMRFRREGVPMGLPGLDEWHIPVTDPEAVAAAKALLAE